MALDELREFADGGLKVAYLWIMKLKKHRRSPFDYASFHPDSS
ncbi:hypothetical protein [Umezakia ovalisporum]|jgi:hypothetical protein